MNEAVLPDGWPRPRGFSEAIKSDLGNTLLVQMAGQLGMPGEDDPQPDNELAGQYERALARIVELVVASGGEPTDITSIRVSVADMAEFTAAGKHLAEAYSRNLGRHFPAMTLLGGSQFVVPGALVEVEATAVIRKS